MDVRVFVIMFEGGRESKIITDNDNHVSGAEIQKKMEAEFGRKIVGVFNADLESGKSYMFLDFSRMRE